MVKNILNCLRTTKRALIWKRYQFVCNHCSPETATKVRYKMLMKKKLNLINPKTLNEKLQYLKLNTYRNSALVVIVQIS